MIEAYPLNWPMGRPRAQSREGARFKTVLGAAIKNIQSEVSLLGGSELVISSNLPLRRDGAPMARAGYIGDTGVAVYFTLLKRPMCFACDRWHGIDHNMQAVAKTIEALCGIERWGSGSMVEQAFTGFAALPAPEQPWRILGVSSNATKDEVRAAYRQLASDHHPDKGGDEQKMMIINAARDAMLRDA
jgi:hypothetical protein